MSRLTRDGTAESVSRDQILRHVRGQGNIHFPCTADHEQDWQPYPVDPYSAICDYHTYIHNTFRRKGSDCAVMYLDNKCVWSTEHVSANQQILISSRHRHKRDHNH